MAAACGGDGFLWYKKVVSVTVSPADSSVTAGSTRQFLATAIYNDHRKVNVSNDCVWSSSNPEFASIGTDGIATGVAAGSTTITATFDDLKGIASLTVTSGPPREFSE